MQTFTRNMKRSILNGRFVAVLLTFAMFTLCSVSTYAQPKYGINSITTVTPPYPITLDGFVAEGGTKISLQILPTDITLSQYPVLLKLVIKGNGITLESKSLTIHEPVYLNGNEFLTLNGSDLQAFFNPDNLNFSGYSKTQYQRNGRLPEGVYTVGFELYDVIRKIPVASVRSTIVFLFLNEVPALTLPMNEQMISAAGTQTVNFRWTTRHSPLAATFFVPEYLFELWEITPAGRNPYDIVKGTRPLYATTLSSPYLAYGIAEPQLQPGKSYAWRVRENDPENRTLFKNNGYTEVYTFTYGRNCPAPELSADKVGTSHLSVNWKADINEKEFELRYREKKKKNAEWYSQSTNLLSGKVDNLKQNTIYEVEVCAVCGDQRSEYSNRLEINTRQNTSFKCGQIDSSRLPQNKNPLRKLSSGDIFNAYGFDVQVKEVTGGTGTFTGKGYVLVPVLNFIKVEVKFDNIQLNEEYQLIGGEVRSVYNLKNSPDKKFGGKDDIFDDLTKLITGDEEKNKFDDMADKTIEVDSVKEIKLENGKVVITDVNGKTEEVSTTSNKIIAVKTEEGKEYVVDTGTGTIYSSGNSGQKAPVGSPSGPVTTATQAGKASTPKYSVSFLPHQLQECGFDYPSGKSPAANYEQVEITGKPTLVPWKSTQAGRIERVVAEIAGGPADSVRYYRESNNVVMTAPGIKANQQQIMLNGLGKNEEDKLYAWYAAYNQGDTSKTYSRVLAGQLNTVSYEKIAIKVVLVPVNNSSCPRADYVQSELNKIYKSAVVEWIVLNGENITVPLAGGENAVFDNTDKDANMNYTPDMKAAINVFSSNPQYNRETYYLFFLDNAKDQTIKGYMPLKKQFGFIFKYNQYPDEYLRTIAHELGHGPFRLYHTFSDKNKYPQPEGATDNLMDYAAASATNLNKYQWDWVHDPEWRIYWGEEEGEGELKEHYYAFHTNKKCDSYTGLLIPDYKTYYSPSGLPFSLPKRACEESFTEELKNTLENKSIFVSKKALTSFKLDDKTYVAKATAQSFVGYIEKSIDINHKEEPLTDTYSPQNFKSLDVWNATNFEYGKNFKEIEKASNYTAAGLIDFPEDITKLPPSAICTKCGESTIRCYCGKACVCLCDELSTGCQHRRLYNGISVPIFSGFETKKIDFINYNPNDNKQKRKVDLYLLKAYQTKFGYDERIISFEKAIGNFFELTSYMEFFYENLAKAGNLSKLNALKTINKANNIYTVANMLKNFDDGNYESAFESVIGFIPAASQFISFLEFTDSEEFLTSMMNATEIQLRNLSGYSGSYAQKCKNDYARIIKYCEERLDTKVHIEEVEYHNNHCTCFKK